MKKLEDFAGLTIYFIGIGGISMSGLCQLAFYFGATVLGSDSGDNPEIDKLKALGIIVNNTHSADNITANIDMVVYTSAIKSDNEEYIRTLELGITLMERAEFLGLISQMYNNVIAISGTHGKTTTTAMIGEIFVSAGLNPTIHIGGESIGLKGNTVIGKNEYFIVEACEYKESFRYLKPTLAIVTNIELDHLDYYKDYSAIHTAFQKFANNSCAVITTCDTSLEHEDITAIFQDWEIKAVEFIGGGYNYNVYKQGVFYDTLRLNMLGYHNLINSLFAIAVADKFGIEKTTINRAISSFMGVGRRYETIHIFSSGCRLIIDYAHHYTEIKNSVAGIKDIYDNILVVFQPHTYSRTEKLFNEFVDTLSAIDSLVLYKTYPAREELIIGGTAEDLYRAVTSKKKAYFDNLDSLHAFIKRNSNKFDCILVLGAGDLALDLKRNYTIV